MLILSKLSALFKQWQEYEKNIPKQLRHNICRKIDEVILSLIERIIAARFAQKEAKKELLTQSILSLDVIRFLLQLLWECKGINNDKYIAVEKQWSEIGKMLWGWKKQTEQ